jgi:hypothetical protein
LQRLRKVRIPSQLGSDMEYWSACVPIVMRVMHVMIEEKLNGKTAA